MAKKTFKVVKEGKYPKFICACGSEMWDNRKKKKSPKHPDLRCKNEDCPHDSKGYPNTVYLTKEQKEKLDTLTGSKKEQYEDSSNYQNKLNKTYDKFNGNIPISMYVAWAKDMAIYLAQATDIKEHDELFAVYKTCIKNMQTVLKEVQEEESTNNTPEIQQEKEVEDIEEDLLDTSEDIDFDEPEVEEDEEEVEDDFSDLEELDI